MTAIHRTRIPLLPLLALPLVVLASSMLSPSRVLAQPEDGAPDAALDQTIDSDQAVAEGRAVLEDGHVDLGPRLLEGAAELMVHDDAEIPAVWRRVDDTVLRVRDDAIQSVPDDPTYAFLGVEPGAAVHVVPQVQRPGVIWVGWNTQDPALMAQIDRGATLSLLGVEGPGDLVVYLQSGVLGDPEVLWRSVVAEPQPIWVEVNTHTHANWVFTEPGTYLVQVEVAAELVDGSSLRDVQTLRFAVGDGTDTEDAFAATLIEDRSEVRSAPAAEEGAGEAGASGGGDGGSMVVAAVVGAAAVLVVLLVVRLVRSRADRRAARSSLDVVASDDR